MKKGEKKSKNTVIETSLEEVQKPTYTQEEVEELLSQQRQLCADYASTKSDSQYVGFEKGWANVMIVDQDSIINAPLPELKN